MIKYRTHFQTVFLFISFYWSEALQSKFDRDCNRNPIEQMLGSGNFSYTCSIFRVLGINDIMEKERAVL